jgi:hypothetical protein
VVACAVCHISPLEGASNFGMPEPKTVWCLQWVNACDAHTVQQLHILSHEIHVLGMPWQTIFHCIAYPPTTVRNLIYLCCFIVLYSGYFLLRIGRAACLHHSVSWNYVCCTLAVSVAA